MRTTGRTLIQPKAPAGESAAPASTSWHNDMLTFSEHIIVKHAAELIARRRQLTVTSTCGLDDSRWLKEVECYIDEVIEESGCHVRCSADLLRAVQWMIAGATAEFATSRAPSSDDLESAAIADAA